MESSQSQIVPHPQGESKITTLEGPEPGDGEPLVIETEGGRYHVQWDDSAPATPYGQLVFFAQFLKAGGLFSRLCAGAPFAFQSNNTPQIVDVLGTLVPSILAGHSRYAHISAQRFDQVSPPILGMSKIISEDSARRALQKLEQLGHAAGSSESFARCGSRCSMSRGCPTLIRPSKQSTVGRREPKSATTRTSRAGRAIPITPTGSGACGCVWMWRCARARSTPANTACPVYGI